METRKFEPNYSNIEKRKNIIPFGRAIDYFFEKPIPISFKIYSTELESVIPTNSSSQIYKASSLYVAPSMVESIYKLKEVSVRITNIPQSVTQWELLELFNSKCPGLFLRSHLVHDRETRVSKGYAYVSCDNIENAREFAKIARKIEIDGFALSSEIILE